MKKYKRPNIKIGKCCDCNRYLGRTYKLPIYITYELYIVTVNKVAYTMSIKELENQMCNWLFKEGIKLSTTQCLLMRADVVQTYLEKQLNTVGDHLLYFSWIPLKLCQSCFDIYKKEIPLR